MAKVLFHSFTIKPFKVPKQRISKTYKKISRKLLAVVVKDKNGNYCARINVPNTESEYLIYPLTEESLNLEGKTMIFTKFLDEHNKRSLIIRELWHAKLNPGNPLHYEVVREGILISGYIVSKDNKKYFSYEQFVAFNETCGHLTHVSIDEDKPIFLE